MLENRNLTAGTRLVARYKARTYSAEVVQTGEGLRYRLEDGREFKSPSAAGSAVMGGIACNGWRFWSLDGLLGPEAPESKAARKATQVGKTIRRVPNQRGLGEGQRRWWCTACCKSFVVDDGQEPEVCPEGHGDEVVDLSDPALHLTPEEACAPMP